MQNSNGLAEPPEGVIAGESAPPESEPDNYDEAMIQQIEGLLKARGEPYTEMNSSELRQKALDTLRKHGVDL